MDSTDAETRMAEIRLLCEALEADKAVEKMILEEAPEEAPMEWERPDIMLGEEDFLRIMLSGYGEQPYGVQSSGCVDPSPLQATPALPVVEPCFPQTSGEEARPEQLPILQAASPEKLGQASDLTPPSPNVQGVNSVAPTELEGRPAGSRAARGQRRQQGQRQPVPEEERLRDLRERQSRQEQQIRQRCLLRQQQSRQHPREQEQPAFPPLAGLPLEETLRRQDELLRRRNDQMMQMQMQMRMQAACQAHLAWPNQENGFVQTSLPFQAPQQLDPGLVAQHVVAGQTFPEGYFPQASPNDQYGGYFQAGFGPL